MRRRVLQNLANVSLLLPFLLLFAVFWAAPLAGGVQLSLQSN
ncbi:MAG TPA: sugar ABC transporter permease, partial [Verrucomicrobiales bacterium]|nr:sugar ABC transporter permease [Verrucomicrobiales bacterium]